MCGRFTLKTLADEVVEQFQLARLADRELALFEPRYNIAPTQDVLVVRRPEGAQRELAVMRWGLLPSWVKEPNKGPPLTNARAETVAEKPSFRPALKSRRRPIIADGSYEWPRAEGGKANRKQLHPPPRK